MDYKMDMRNAAYTYEYLKYRKEKEVELFNVHSIHDDTIKKDLGDGYYYFEEEFNNIKGNAHISASKVKVFFDNKQIYEFKCLYENLLFCQLIKHSNGKKYLMFNRELYGYSVLELDTMKEFHYYPKENMKEGRETFIWTDVFYNPNNNFMAGFGCYWGSPYFYILIDFSDPFKVVPYLETCSISNENDPEDPNGECWVGNDFVFLEQKTKNIITIKEQQYLSEYNKLFIDYDINFYME